MLSYLLYTLFGLIFGSFASMASYRYVKDESFWGRSRCNFCSTELAIIDLIPILSYIYRRGKCGYCSAHIPIRYVLIEAITAVAFGLVGMQNMPLVCKLITCFLVVFLVIGSFTDIMRYIIPDEVQIILAITGVCYAFVVGRSMYDIAVSLFVQICVCILLVLFGKLYLKQDGIGMGDIKFLAISGLYIPMSKISMFFLIAGTCGILYSLLWTHVFKRGRKFPFMPALSIALYSCITFLR